MGKTSSSIQTNAAVLSQLQVENEALKKENEDLRRKLERMNKLLLNAQRARFGQSSEKRSYVLPDSEQTRIFNEAEAVQDPKAPEPTEETLVNAHTRKPKRTVDDLTEGLLVEKIILDLTEKEQICGTCGSRLKKIGEKLVRREIETTRKQVKVLEYYTITYVCPDCEKETGYAHIYEHKALPPLLKHSLASPSAVTDVMVQKYVDGIPLARQEKIWKRDGIALARATLGNWVIETSQVWLKPLYRLIRQHLTSLNVIHADETVVQVHGEEGKANTSEFPDVGLRQRTVQQGADQVL